MKTATYVPTHEEHDALCDARELREDLAELTDLELARILKAERNPAFEGFVDPETVAAAGARGGVPPLGAGAPQRLVDEGAEGQAERDERDEDQEVHLPSTHHLDPMAVGAGLEEFSQEDVRIPVLKVRQAQTKKAEGVKDGHWFLTSDLDGAKPVRELVFLAFRKERSLMLPYSGGDAAAAMVERISVQTRVDVPDKWEGPVCFSRDRKIPVVQEGIRPLAATCAECPMSKWRMVRGKRVQDCRESYRILFLDVETGLPVVYYARGGGIRPMGDLLTTLQVATRRHKVPACGFTFHASTKSVEREDGNYYEAVYGQLHLIEDQDLIAEYAAIREACASVEVEEE